MLLRLQPNKIKLDLSSILQNPFNLTFAFMNAAQKSGWQDDEIQEVLAKCTENDHNHTLSILNQFCIA